MSMGGRKSSSSVLFPEAAALVPAMEDAPFVSLNLDSCNSSHLDEESVIENQRGKMAYYYLSLLQNF